MKTLWEDAPDDWHQPEWDNASHVHEWKNYISEKVKKIWDSFTDKQKIEIAKQADELASQEEWD